MTSAIPLAPEVDPTAPVTRVGAILGTPAYMAPEQVQGKPLDKRVDIWAFGCVLYEMVTGEQPFRGETISDVLAAVLTAEPSWDRVPRSLQRLLRRCLQRDPANRLRDIGDALALLDEAPAVASPPLMPTRRERWAWSAAVLVLVTAIALLAVKLRPTDAPALPQVRFDISPPDGYKLLPYSVVPSNDGRSIAFLAEAAASGHQALWIYTVSTGVSREVVAFDRTSGTSNPFWSPDGRSMGIHSGGKLRRVDVSSGTLETVCDAPGVVGVGSWSKDDVIVFVVTTGEGNEGLMRVSASGGTPVLLTRADRADRQLGHGNPALLPDGRFFVYQAFVADGPRDIYLGSVDATPEAQSSTPLFSFAGPVRYAASPDPNRGYLLFMRDGKLMAQPFDNRQRRLDGPVVIVPGPVVQ
jgi:hypothetical protein